jgi:predicted nucleic acid-binding protein
VIAIDTNIFIYHLSSDPVFGNHAKNLMLMIESGQVKAIASIITYTEILTFPFKEGRRDLVKKYEELLLNFPNLKFIDVNQEIAHRAAELKGATPDLRLIDAILIATAEFQKCDVFLTEDARLKKKGFLTKVQTLREYFASE